VTHIKLAVYQGNKRKNRFQLQYWTGSAWTTVVDSQTSGTTTGLQSFSFAAVQTSKVRYVGTGTCSTPEAREPGTA